MQQRAPSDRIASRRIGALDLVRGVAVLGILAVNIAGFAGPQMATLTPNLPHPASAVDEAVFALVMVVFEGKMRALFSMLFGASMLLFIERADDAGRHGEALQIRRLGWLALFGYLHSILLWWGDILFVYALCGFVALALRGLSLRWLVGLALGMMALDALWGTLSGLPLVWAEEQVRLGTASAGQARDVAQTLAQVHQNMAQELAQARLGFGAMALDKLAHAPFWPLVMTIATFAETLPLMLLGMALYRSGFTTGAWSRRRLWLVAGWGVGLGLPMALALTQWAWARHFPPLAMPDLMASWSIASHVLMALGYYALLMLAAPWLGQTAIGGRLAAAGRMAFSNYLGTSMVMCAVFYGWGLGLFTRVGHAAQVWFVLGAWALMLGWSAPWLAHFRQGPLEWLWRSAVEGRRLPLRKARAQA